MNHPCYSESVLNPHSSSPSAFSRVTALAEQRPVHTAFSWLHLNSKTILDWQMEMIAVPAPPFGEQNRARWMESRFREIGLSQVETDAIGNVIGVLPAAKLPPESTGPVVLISAHIDTVFPIDTPINPVLEGDTIKAPGACDNAAGVAGMLATVRALIVAGIELPAPLVVMANVGEEGEGDLRGVRHFYNHSPFASRVAAHIVLDGAGSDSAVTQALGSLRFQVMISGPGGHSFTDAGTPNPITALATALAELAETPLPREPLTTFNPGTIRGGISVNAIPESAQALIDFRSTDPAQLARLAATLRNSVQDAVEHWNQKAEVENSRGQLTFAITKIGDRPAARLPENSPMQSILLAVDRHLSLQSNLRLGSTDANIPLSLGIQSLSIGAGGEGGSAHTLNEWYSPNGREIGLKRMLLLTLAMIEWASEQ